jgi:UDP-N-acetylglucosamine 2-epimerase (non-hydrolysing)
MTDRLRIMSLFGTRPEAIKMAPVVRLLKNAEWAEQVVAVTGQHREMLDQVLEIFDIQPDIDLDLMTHGQSLSELTGRTLQAVTSVLRDTAPGLLLVQGDTTSAFAGALAAFYEQIPVAHVEAGLRSFDHYNPFPEEINRRLVSVVAELHFPPTQRARENLLAEGVPDARIHVTGNTVVDALLATSSSPRLADLPPAVELPLGQRLILVTLHRRESWGTPMADICASLRGILDAFPGVSLLFPMHRNPVVRQVVVPILGAHPRAHLVEPLDYLQFVKAMTRCHLIVTDSGGIQEEAPALAKPVLVLRDTTERPEAIEAGTARLVGTARDAVFEAVSDLLTDPPAYHAMAHAASPFGDGQAAERIARVLRNWALQTERLNPHLQVGSGGELTSRGCT